MDPRMVQITSELYRFFSYIPRINAGFLRLGAASILKAAFNRAKTVVRKRDLVLRHKVKEIPVTRTPFALKMDIHCHVIFNCVHE